MKKIIWFAVVLAVVGYYVSPVFVAKAGPDPAALSGLTEDLGTAKVLYMRVTAYASEVDETDSTPFITANGTYVHDGIVATNVLPFGTRVEIPELFGNKVFTVEDRMNAKMKDMMDIWMPSRGQAIRFGSNYADILVLGSSTPSSSTNRD